MIDTHAHVFHHGIALDPARRYTPAYEATISQYTAVLDRHAVGRAVLVPISIAGTNNEYLVDAVAMSGGRFKGLVNLAPSTDPETLGELSRNGICGIRLNFIGRSLPEFDKGQWADHLAACAAHGWIVSVNDEAKRLPKIVEPLLDLGLTVLLDHFGHPDPGLGSMDPAFGYVLDLADSDRVWVKMSGGFRFGWQRSALLAEMVLARYSPARLLWGSDWPFTGHEEQVSYQLTQDRFCDWVTSAQLRERILYANPANLFGFNITTTSCA